MRPIKKPPVATKKAASDFHDSQGAETRRYYMQLWIDRGANYTEIMQFFY